MRLGLLQYGELRRVVVVVVVVTGEVGGPGERPNGPTSSPLLTPTLALTLLTMY